jgi:hypothetical protein
MTTTQAYFRPPNPPAMPSYVNVEKHYYNAGSDLPVKPDMSLEIDLSRSVLPLHLHSRTHHATRPAHTTAHTHSPYASEFFPFFFASRQMGRWAECSSSSSSPRPTWSSSWTSSSVRTLHLISLPNLQLRSRHDTRHDTTRHDTTRHTTNDTAQVTTCTRGTAARTRFGRSTARAAGPTSFGRS